MRLRTTIVMGGLGMVIGGCLERLDVQCVENSNCNLSGGGLCTLASTGNHWCAYPDPACSTGYRYSDDDVGDGVSGVCTERPQGHAPITSGEFADEVFGQDDLVSSFVNSGGISASSLNHPTAVAIAGTHLWISDSSNARVLQWNAIPVVDRPLANLVLGQKDSTSMDSVTDQATLRIGVNGLSATVSHVFVADYASNRVVIYSSIPTQTGVPAAIVLGQGSFNTSDTGKSASGLYSPYDVWSDDVRLVVADTANSRVLIWNSIPTTNGKAADIGLSTRFSGWSQAGVGQGQDEFLSNKA